jgi:phage baseplate assembly protein gpV
VSSILEIVRRVVEQEMVRNRGSLLGMVSTVFPHTAENDENNYEVNVKLKHEGLELRRVPVAVGHVGVAAPPRAGDLVLVQFLNGDLNQPVVTGRFYHADERAPLHKEDEVLFEHRVSDGTLNHLRFATDGTIYLQRDVTKPGDNSEAKTSVKIDGASGEIEIKVGDDTKVELKSDKIKITGDVEIDGDLVVLKGSNKTTISGNSIEGA